MIALAISALTSQGGWSVILLWPALSCGVVAFAYLSGDVSWFGKRVDGSRSPLATVALLPYLVFAHVVWLLQASLSREPATGSVNSFLVVSRRLRSHELPSHYERVCDLTCELLDPRAIRARPGYVCHPILDAGVCAVEELIELARRLPPTDGRHVLIHCANGHGQTGMFAAVWLLTHGFATSVEHVMQQLHDARAGIRLRSRQRKLVIAVRERLIENDGADPKRLLQGGANGGELMHSRSRCSTGNRRSLIPTFRVVRNWMSVTTHNATRNPMLKSLFLSVLLACAGCDTAARQHQAEQARAQQQVDDLRALGEKMHNTPSSDPTETPE